MSGAGKALFPRTHSLALTDRGDLVAGTCYRIIVADVHARKRIVSFRALQNSARLSFSPDGSALAIKNTFGQIAVAEPRTGRVLRSFGEIAFGENSDIKYSPCGSFLITATKDHDIRIINARTGGVERRWTFPGEFVSDISHSADRKKWCFLHYRIVQSASEKSRPPHLTIWDWPFDSYFEIPTTIAWVRRATISPDGRLVALDGHQRNPVIDVFQVIDLAGNILVNGRGDFGLNVRWSQDGSMLAISDIFRSRITTFPEMKTIKEFDSSDNYDTVFSKDNSFVIRSANNKAFITPLFAPTSSERQ